MRTIHHENGDITEIWYGHEEITTGVVIVNVLVYALGALGIVMPTTLLGGLGVALLGAVLGLSTAGIVMLLSGNSKRVSTTYAHN